MFGQSFGVGFGLHAPGGGFGQISRGHHHILKARLAQSYLVVAGGVWQTHMALGIAKARGLKTALLQLPGRGVAVVGIVNLGRLRGAAGDHDQRQRLVVWPVDGEVGGLRRRTGQA